MPLVRPCRKWEDNIKMDLTKHDKTLYAVFIWERTTDSSCEHFGPLKSDICLIYTQISLLSLRKQKVLYNYQSY